MGGSPLAAPSAAAPNASLVHQLFQAKALGAFALKLAPEHACLLLGSGGALLGVGGLEDREGHRREETLHPSGDLAPLRLLLDRMGLRTMVEPIPVDERPRRRLAIGICAEVVARAGDLDRSGLLDVVAHRSHLRPSAISCHLPSVGAENVPRVRSR